MRNAQIKVNVLPHAALLPSADYENNGVVKTAYSESSARSRFAQGAGADEVRILRSGTPQAVAVLCQVGFCRNVQGSRCAERRTEFIDAQ